MMIFIKYLLIYCKEKVEKSEGGTPSHPSYSGCECWLIYQKQPGFALTTLNDLFGTPAPVKLRNSVPQIIV